MLSRKFLNGGVTTPSKGGEWSLYPADKLTVSSSMDGVRAPGLPLVAGEGGDVTGMPPGEALGPAVRAELGIL